MKLKSTLSAAALCAVSSFIFLSCSKTERELSSGTGSAPAGLQEQRPYTSDEIDRMAYIPGLAVVKLTSEAADALASGSGEIFGTVSETLGMKHVERLIPDAGEFEPRHRKYGLHRYYLVEFDSAVPLSKAQTVLESLDCVESFDRRHRICRKDRTDDPGYSYLWEYSGKYSINVEDAWKYTTGDPSVVVCVVDEGVGLRHEDLSWNCGTKHKDFVRGNSSVTAGDHGCHVAGTIAGVRNNGKGMAGIAGGDYAAGKKGVTLMSAQVFLGNSAASSFEDAIIWGADNGAVISQNSWGNDYDLDGDGRLSAYEKSVALNDRIEEPMATAIDYFIDNAGCDKDGNQLPGSPMKGGVVVFAAGNDGLANGVPASYAPVIAVGAVGSSGRLSSFSNYGSWVDICAPGEDIYSCVANGGYALYDGTSMACPHVSGALALLVSEFGGEGFTNADLEDILLKGANPDLINKSGKAAGPYLDIMGSMRYGLEKYRRQDNNPPVITTSYTGDFNFRQWEEVSIPFTVSDPDGDNVQVSAEIEGRGRLVKSTSEADVYNFELLCELVSDFTPKKAVITATDMYGGTAKYEFTYRVTENRAPVVSAAPSDILFQTESRAEVPLAGIFTDPDGEQLTVSATVIPSDVVGVSVDGDVLTVVRRGNGLATVTLTARDRMGATVTADFRVLSRSGSSAVDYYPNPVKDFLNIRPGSVSPVEVGVTVCSLSGAVLFEDILPCSAFDPGRVDMSGFAPGQYRLALSAGDEKSNHLIVKR